MRQCSTRSRDWLDEQAASVLDGVPFGQPALSLAAQLQRRAARGGPRRAGAPGGKRVCGCRKIIGAELFRLVARDRELGHDPEMELRAAARATASWRARGNERLIITESEAGFGDPPESAVAGATQKPALAGRPSASGATAVPGRWSADHAAR